ncbi:hypothetical protein [Undibacterium oligocarboniphilum]|uniref:Helix-turn-helix domain-containing protein n=1 Tax=Undibacterium oligocarboniphilum TaxID=666702 RepID=A0A850QLL8_9BURK|nr:hypothetical protein [Undibacterium oligocarboniphilum]MBC3870302.1 hypothetical protein [Undibacterium oligocarboniphilum]NVO78293.1 hypothetical protein [Undibacterium oligocarboniphilum]
MGREKLSSKLKISGGFFPIPHQVSNSLKYRGLSAKAVKLLVDIGSQFNGRNNGDFTAAWKIMQPRGWKSEETLHSAKKELLTAGFIAETRKGRRPNLCSLYGITWIKINPSPKFDIKPYAFPYGAWEHSAPEIQTEKSNALTTTTVFKISA